MKRFACTVVALCTLLLAALIWTPAARAVRTAAAAQTADQTIGLRTAPQEEAAGDEDAKEEPEDDQPSESDEPEDDQAANEEEEEEGEAEDDDQAAGDDEAQPTAKDEAKGEKPPELDGIFQPVHADPVQIKVEEWTQLTVVEAVEHGAQVQAGDMLIRLETDKLEQAIEETEHEIGTDELAVKDAEIKLDLAERSQDLALQAATAADRIATEELKDFVATGRDRQTKSLEQSLENAQNRLAYQAEELEQLERMYEADDLTEETEEIILKRTRDAVENARYSLEVIKDSQRKGLQFELPRNQEQLEQSVARAALELEEARSTAPQSLQRQQLQVAKQKRDLEHKKERLERLRTDLKQMTVTAPRSGVVYYGTLRRGKWTDPASIEMMLQPGGSPKAKTELLTIVELRPLTVRVSVPEKSLQLVKPGAKATVKPVAFPDVALSAEVTERSAIPQGSGQFEAILALDEAASPPAELVPGMNAKVTIEAAESEAEADE